jgi:hypothetical protein
MNLKRSDKKKELAELRTLWHVLKGQTMPLGGALPDPSPMGGRGGHEGQKGTNFENLGYAALGDLNDPVSICAQVKWEANRLKSSKNLLNLLRHLLLIPTHQKVGAKIWEVLEFFVHGVCILRDEHDVSKDLTRLSLEAFKKALNRKDKIVVDDKLALLHTIEEALKILFPQCETQGDDDVELIWEGIGDGDANDDDDSDGDDDDSEKEVDEDGATEYNSSDEETAKSAKKVKPRMRVNPKTGESEIQADMELDKVRHTHHTTTRHTHTHTHCPASPIYHTTAATTATLRNWWPTNLRIPPRACRTRRTKRRPSPRWSTSSCPPFPTSRTTSPRLPPGTLFAVAGCRLSGEVLTQVFGRARAVSAVFWLVVVTHTHTHTHTQ